MPDHGRLSQTSARGLRTLRRRIADAGVPLTTLDRNLILATWNVREFGRRRRKKVAIHYIAEVISNFSLVGLTEVRDNLNDLYRVIKILGPTWDVVFSDFNVDRAGNRERVAYLFDNRSVRFTGLAADADPPRRKVQGEYRPIIEWWRSPFMASFTAGSFDFILISAHIRWGTGAAERVAPLQALAEWVHKRRNEKFVVDKDIIVMGDFNIPDSNDATFRAITSQGLRVPKALRGVHGTNLARNKRYDQILHYPRASRAFTDEGGTVDFFRSSFKPLFGSLDKRACTYQLSDHLPLWIEVNVDLTDERLDQILRG